MIDIAITIDEKTLRELVYNHLAFILGDAHVLKMEDIKIEVKSKHNWKTEWESADFRATVRTIK